MFLACLPATDCNVAEAPTKESGAREEIKCRRGCRAQPPGRHTAMAHVGCGQSAQASNAFLRLLNVGCVRRSLCRLVFSWKMWCGLTGELMSV